MAVTDLTGTKWEFNNLIKASLFTNFNINFKSNNVSYNVLRLFTDDDGEYIQYNNTIVFDLLSTPPWNSSEYRTITINSGIDTTNATLINWIIANASQIVEPDPEPEPANTFSFGNLPIANMYFGTRQVKKVYLGNALVWEKEQTLISFTIVGVSYQAEEGMTWQEWINSPYNINGFIATAGNYVRPTSGGDEVFYGNKLVHLSDTIVANTAYFYKHSGGAED